MATAATTTTTTSTNQRPQLPAHAATTTLLPSNSQHSRPLLASHTTSSKPSCEKPACSTGSTHLLKSLKRDGYVHIEGLLNPTQIASLRNAATNITKLARAGQWPHIRTVPKQFPPWPSQPPPEEEGGIWGVQHLLHPSCPHRLEFAKLYFGNPVICVVKELLGLNLYDPRSDDKIVMELLNLLVSPSGSQDFELRWHRDDVRWEVDPLQEKRELELKSPGGRQAHCQYNIALVQDESLVVVPGSHVRVRTEQERSADPYADVISEGQVVVKMKPGDAVFYDSNIVHRGVYKGVDLKNGEEGRLTLHGSVGLYGHSEERARNVLQHGVGEWVDGEDAAFEELSGKCHDRAEGMRWRLVEMGTGEDVGFSLEG